MGLNNCQGDTSKRLWHLKFFWILFFLKSQLTMHVGWNIRACPYATWHQRMLDPLLWTFCHPGSGGNMTGQGCCWSPMTKPHLSRELKKTPFYTRQREKLYLMTLDGGGDHAVLTVILGLPVWSGDEHRLWRPAVFLSPLNHFFRFCVDFCNLHTEKGSKWRNKVHHR